MRQLRALPHCTSAIEAVKQRPQAFTRTELVALGSEHELRTALASGEITRLFKNCYVATEHATSFEARADAALTWAGEGAALTGASACFVWTLTKSPPSRIDLVVPQSKRLSPPPWVRIKRAPWGQNAFSVNDFRAVTPEIAIVDGYADLNESDRTDVVFGAISRKIVTTRRLREALADLPRIRARRSLTSRIEAAERGAESWLEEVGLREVFADREFDYFLRQHKFISRGRHYRLDMFDPFSRTAVELDSTTWHSGEENRLRDIRRDAELAAAGILTIRLPTQDLTQAQEWCREVVRNTVATRGSDRSLG